MLVDRIQAAIKSKKTLVFIRVFFVFLILFSSSKGSIWAVTDFQTGETAGDSTRGVPNDVATIQGFERIFGNFVNVIFELAGVLLFITILTAGFKYLTSQGDPKALEGAKGTLTHAIIGLVVLLFAYVILVLINQITGANVLNFTVRVRP